MLGQGITDVASQPYLKSLPCIARNSSPKYRYYSVSLKCCIVLFVYNKMLVSSGKGNAPVSRFQVFLLVYFHLLLLRLASSGSSHNVPLENQIRNPKWKVCSQNTEERKSTALWSKSRWSGRSYLKQIWGGLQWPWPEEFCLVTVHFSFISHIS